MDRLRSLGPTIILPAAVLLAFAGCKSNAPAGGDTTPPPADRMAHIRVTGGFQATVDLPVGTFRLSSGRLIMSWEDASRQLLLISGTPATGSSKTSMTGLTLAVGVDQTTPVRHHFFQSSTSGECTVTLTRVNQTAAAGSFVCERLTDRARVSIRVEGTFSA